MSYRGNCSDFFSSAVILLRFSFYRVFGGSISVIGSWKAFPWLFFFPIEGFFYFSLFWKSFLVFYILRIKISWYFYRLIVKSMLFYLKWAESSQFMAYRKEWLLDYLHYLLSHGKKKLLRFQTLGFCRSNFWEQSSTEQRTRVELRLFFLR